MNIFKRLFKRSEKTRVQNYAAITEAELAERFLQAPGNPLYLAVLAVIDEEALRLMDDARGEQLPEAALRYRLGGAQALLDLKEALEARQRQAEIEEGKRADGKTG